MLLNTPYYLLHHHAPQIIELILLFMMSHPNILLRGCSRSTQPSSPIGGTADLLPPPLAQPPTTPQAGTTIGAPPHCNAHPTESTTEKPYNPVVAGPKVTPRGNATIVHQAVEPPLRGRYNILSREDNSPTPNSLADVAIDNNTNDDEADEGSLSHLPLPASIDGPDSTSLVVDGPDTTSLVGNEPAAIDSTLVGDAPGAPPPFPDMPQLERTCGDLIDEIRTDIGVSPSFLLFTQDTLLALITSVQRELAATQQRMFSKLQSTLFSTLVTTDALARTDATILELQASVKTLIKRDSKHSLTLENVDSNLLHITEKVLPNLSTNLATLRADYYGWFPTREPLQDSHDFTPSSLSPSAVGNKTLTGQLESQLANLQCLLDSHLPPVASLCKDLHSDFETEIKPFIHSVGTSVYSIKRKLNTITEHVMDLGAYLKTAHPTTSGPATFTKSVVSIGDGAPPLPGTVTHAVPTPDGPPRPDAAPSASVPPTNRWRNVDPSSLGFVPLTRVSTTPRPPPTHQHPSMGQPPLVLVPISDDVSDDESVGGAICLPHLANRDCLAHGRGASWHDVLKLALEAYHIRYDGVKQLLERTIMKCGLTRSAGHVEDASFCYQDVSCVHCITYDGWYDSHWNRSGPNVPYIVEKALSFFPRLSLLRWKRQSGSLMTCSQLASITSYL